MSSDNELLEEVAQMLYDKAEIAGENEDKAISQEMKYLFEEKSRTFCEAAELVRRMKA